MSFVLISPLKIFVFYDSWLKFCVTLSIPDACEKRCVQVPKIQWCFHRIECSQKYIPIFHPLYSPLPKPTQTKRPKKRKKMGKSALPFKRQWQLFFFLFFLFPFFFCMLVNILINTQKWCCTTRRSVQCSIYHFHVIQSCLRLNLKLLNRSI